MWSERFLKKNLGCNKLTNGCSIQHFTSFTMVIFLMFASGCIFILRFLLPSIPPPYIEPQLLLVMTAAVLHSCAVVLRAAVIGAGSVTLNSFVSGSLTSLDRKLQRCLTEKHPCWQHKVSAVCLATKPAVSAGPTLASGETRGAAQSTKQHQRNGLSFPSNTALLDFEKHQIVVQ